GAPERNRFSARVTDVVFQGESLRVFLALDDGTPLSLRQPSHFEAARRIPPIGERLAVSLHPQDTIIVPKTDG
ncbi:TOBE domain-containing protein, partial [Bosea psychrotolerans]